MCSAGSWPPPPSRAAELSHDQGQPGALTRGKRESEVQPLGPLLPACWLVLLQTQRATEPSTGPWCPG